MEDNKPDPSTEEKSDEPKATEPVEDNSVQQRLAELEAKTTEQTRNLAASKAEALRLKQENEELKTQPKTPQDESQLSDQELFDRYMQNSSYFQDQFKTFKQGEYNQSRDGERDKFLDKYPEYKPENDPGDKKWKTLTAELAEYRNPKNPNDWGKLLAKAHKAIQPDNSLEKGKALGMAQAKIEEQTKLGGGSSGGTSTPKKKLSPEQEAVRDKFKQQRPDYFKD